MITEYQDDFCLLADDKDHLHHARREIARFLTSLRLELSERKSQIFPVREGIPWLGYKVFADKVLLRRENYKRAKKRLRKQQRQFAAGQIDFSQILQSLRSWIAHVTYARSYRLREKLLGQFVFSRKNR